MNPTGGVTFVEGSWVKVPAFTGAVARNVVGVESGKAKRKTADRIERAFSMPAPQVAPGALQKAARLGGFGDPEESESEEEMAPPVPTKPESPLGDIEEEIKQTVLDEVRDNLKTELTKKKIEEQVLPPSDAPNDTIIKQARSAGMKTAYLASLRALVGTSTSDMDLMNRVAALNTEIGVSIPVSIYRAALRVGARDLYRDLPEFLKTAGEVLGRPPSNREAVTLVRLATLLEEHKIARRIAETRSLKERKT